MWEAPKQLGTALHWETPQGRKCHPQTWGGWGGFHRSLNEHDPNWILGGGLEHVFFQLLGF